MSNEQPYIPPLNITEEKCWHGEGICEQCLHTPKSERSEGTVYYYHVPTARDTREPDIRVNPPPTQDPYWFNTSFIGAQPIQQFQAPEWTGTVYGEDPPIDYSVLLSQPSVAQPTYNPWNNSIGHSNYRPCDCLISRFHDKVHKVDKVFSSLLYNERLRIPQLCFR